MLGLNRGQPNRPAGHAYVTIPRALAALIQPDEPEPYRITRPQIDDVVGVKAWLKGRGWESEQQRSEDARRLLFVAWRFRGVRLARRGLP